MRAAKVQASLRIRAVSPEPSLLAHTSSEWRGTFRQKARSLGPLNGWACAVKICQDGMLEDTNSLDGAHVMSTRFDYNVINISESMESLKILTIYERLFLRKAKFMYKVSNSLTPVYIKNLFNQRSHSEAAPVLRSNIAVFSEKTDVPHLPNQSMVAISVMKLWPWKLGQGHQNLISYWSCPVYIGLQIW